jgi:hypothetical protein
MYGSFPAQTKSIGPVDDGSYLTMYWIDEDKLGTQQAWVSEQMKLLAEAGRTFDERSVQTATAYDHLGSWERDDDGVPPFLALDRRYAGVVWTVLERADDSSVEDLAAWLAGDFLPRFDGSPVAIGAMFSPRRTARAVARRGARKSGVRNRVFVTFFVETDVRDAFDRWFATLGDDLAATGRARALLVAPFIPTIPGTDTYIDQLW